MWIYYFIISVSLNQGTAETKQWEQFRFTVHAVLHKIKACIKVNRNCGCIWDLFLEGIGFFVAALFCFPLMLTY